MGESLPEMQRQNFFVTGGDDRGQFSELLCAQQEQELERWIQKRLREEHEFYSARDETFNAIAARCDQRVEWQVDEAKLLVMRQHKRELKKALAKPPAVSAAAPQDLPGAANPAAPDQQDEPQRQLVRELLAKQEAAIEAFKQELQGKRARKEAEKAEHQSFKLKLRMSNADGKECSEEFRLELAPVAERLRRLCSAFAGPQAEQARDT